uniref:Peptidase metallopeptidase domain-containing protein n=1 Tax=Cucumis melo TaxID=3656 RepID=A0A9I9DP58_CUCME
MDFKSFYLQLFLLLTSLSLFHPISSRDLNHIHGPSQFLFPKYLLGSRKGHNIEGTHAIKTYLQHYGYLSKNYNIIDTNGVYNNAYDEQLECSVKKYQKFFKLNESGILDRETLSQMSQPRCSVPDIFESEDNETSITTSNLHIRSRYAFFPGRPKWSDSRNLTYSLIKNFPEKFEAAIVDAFMLWFLRSRFCFTYVSEGQKSDITISFEVGDHGDGHPFKGGVLAHAFSPEDGRLHFNGDKSFSSDLEEGKYHIRTVAAHELGHSLGLAHTNIEAAIMYPTLPSNFSKILSQDDVDGLWNFYGQSEDSTKQDVISTIENNMKKYSDNMSVRIIRDKQELAKTQ